MSLEIVSLEIVSLEIVSRYTHQLRRISLRISSRDLS